MTGRSANIVNSVAIQWRTASGGMFSYNLVQALRSTQASWACTNDENVNGAVAKSDDAVSDRILAAPAVDNGSQVLLHVGVAHPALKNILEAGHTTQGLAGDVQHRKMSTAGSGSG